MRVHLLKRKQFLFCLLGLALSSHSAFGEFDAAVVLKKAIWTNLAASVLPLAKVELPNGAMSIVDAVICDVTENRARLLVALKEKNPEAHIVVAESDCALSAMQVAAPKRQVAYDAVAFISVMSEGESLRLAASDVAPRPEATLTPALLQDVRSYSASFGQRSIDVREGAINNRVELLANFVEGGLVLKARHPSMPHSLRTVDPTFVVSTGPGNTKIVISHAAVSKVHEIHLRDKEFPINGTNARFKIDSYSGGANSVTLHATIKEAGLTLAGTATWSGSDLKLSGYTIKSTRDCSHGNSFEKNVCNLAKEAETKTAQALAALAWQKYQSSPLIPLTRNERIKFELYGRRVYLSGQTLTTSATATELTITLDSYVGVDR